MSRKLKPLLKAEEYTPACALCRHGKQAPDGSSVLCGVRGVMRKQSCCKKDDYDPLKRKPECVPLLPEFDPEQFAL